MRGEDIVERVILASRWLLVAFYLGLAAGLVVYAAAFLLKLAKVAAGLAALSEEQMILAMLGLVDSALVASLLVMVMISGYENFVSRLNAPGGSPELAWLGKLDTGSLKIKVASSIVAISSIHLLQVFMDATEYPNDKILWFVVLHLTFVVSALLLGVLDRLSAPHRD